MEDSSSHRPGRAVRIQSINTISAVTKPNEYVDPYVVTNAVNNSTGTPDPARRNANHDSKQKSTHSSTEKSENIFNERKEQLHTSSKAELEDKPPALPPRAPPPLPPRARRNSSCISDTVCRPLTPSTLPPAHSLQRSKSLTHTHDRLVQPSGLTLPLVNNRHRALPDAVLISTGSNILFIEELRPDKRRIVKQPRSTTAHNECEVTVSLDTSKKTTTSTIICPDCRQCRCKSCTGDRQLPEHWLCEGNCKCSADNVVDTLSCMCCVKSCFRSCIDNRENGSAVDPCACTNAPQCCFRWTALTMLTVCLPCLLCYWPLRGAVSAATACYNSPCCRRRGCNCDKTP